MEREKPKNKAALLPQERVLGGCREFGHGNDAFHGKRLVQERFASLNQNSRGLHMASCSFLWIKTNSLQTQQPHDIQRPLERLSAEAGDTKRPLERDFFGFSPHVCSFYVHVLLPACLENSGDAEEPEVGDHHLPIVIEDILGLEVLVENTLGMQVSHSLGWNRERKTAPGYKKG